MSTLILEIDSALASGLERLATQANTTVADLAASALKSVVSQGDRSTATLEKALGHLNRGLRSGDGQPLTRDEVYHRARVH
ncbi:MAG: hypothetical protein JWO94_2916 [Verrucomicrobiaceae bacterium]|nr:hypothetical protein [Verrucomicrobiaceae bacterium]